MSDDFANLFIRFFSTAVADGTLAVLGVEGVEQISRPYEFRLELASRNGDLDFANLLDHRARLEIKQGMLTAGNQRATTTLKIHGWLASFEQVGMEGEWAYYRAVLVPGLWKAGLNKNSSVFQDVHVIDMVKDILTSQSYGYGLDVDISKVTDKGPKRDYIAQYQESDLDFIHRWLEHEGIYYYFTHDGDEEKLVFADKKEGYATIPGSNQFRYRPQPEISVLASAGAGDSEDQWYSEETISGLVARFSAMPKEVRLKDYNWDKPGTALDVKATVASGGKGVVYEYNNHFKTESEGKALATVRAEAINCRQLEFHGRGEGRGFHAGFVFRLSEHFRNSFNQEYLIVSVNHSAIQRLPLAAGATAGVAYQNTFTAIPSSVTFRPRRVTNWPNITGVMHGKVDGSAASDYSQIDSHGRYKVQMGFDSGTRQAGQASKYVRKAEPYAGPDQGMHFPLLKGSEVIVSHVDGNPDRPIIVGAMFNGANGNVVGDANLSVNRIRTPGETQIVMDDTRDQTSILLETKDEKTQMKFDATKDAEKIWIKEPNGQLMLDGTDGADRITLETTNSATKLRMGTMPSGEVARETCGAADGIRFETDGQLDGYVGGDVNLHVMGKKNEKVVGTSDWTITGKSAEYKYGDWFTFKASVSSSVSIGLSADVKVAGGISICVGADIALKAAAAFNIEFGASLTLKASASKEFNMATKKVTTAKDKIEICDGKFTVASRKDMFVQAAQRVILQGAAKLPPPSPADESFKAWAKGVIAKASAAAKPKPGAPSASPPPSAPPSAVPPPLPIKLVDINSQRILIAWNATTKITLNDSGIELKCGASSLKLGPSGIESKPMVKAG